MSPLKFGETFSGSFKLAFRNWGAFFRAVGPAIFATTLVSFVVSLYMANQVLAPIFDQIQKGSANPNDLVGAILPVAAVSLLAGVLSLFVTIAAGGIGLVVADALRAGRTAPRLSEAWGVVGPRFSTLVGVSFSIYGIVLAMVLVVGAIILALYLVSPALGIAALVTGVVIGSIVILILLLRWALAVPVALFESVGAFAALKRSSAITVGSKGAIFGIFAAIGLSVTIPGAILTSMLSPTDAALPSLGQLIAQSVAGFVVNLVMTAVIASALLIAYRTLTAPPEATAPLTSPAAGPPALPPT